MKNWKVVYTIIIGTIFAHECDTFEELEAWLAQRAEGLRPITQRLTVWELYGDEYKQRYSWKRA